MVSTISSFDWPKFLYIAKQSLYGFDCAYGVFIMGVRGGRAPISLGKWTWTENGAEPRNRDTMVKLTMISHTRWFPVRRPHGVYQRVTFT